MARTLTIIFFLALASSLPAQERYLLYPMPDPNITTSAQIAGVTDHSLIGRYYDSSTSQDAYFRWDLRLGEVVKDYPPAGGLPILLIFGCNSHDEAVGAIFNSMGNRQPILISTDGQIHNINLNGQNAVASSINDNHLIAGTWIADGTNTIYRYSPGQYEVYPTSPNYLLQCVAINTQGVVVARRKLLDPNPPVGSNFRDTFLWGTDGSVVIIPPLMAGHDCTPTGASSNYVVGYSTMSSTDTKVHGFQYSLTAHRNTELPPLQGWTQSRANGVQEIKGHVLTVGTSFIDYPGAGRATVWYDGIPFDLENRTNATTGQLLITAESISPAGQIAGMLSNENTFLPYVVDPVLPGETYGDANGDGTLRSDDLNYYLRAFLGLIPLTEMSLRQIRDGSWGSISLGSRTRATDLGHFLRNFVGLETVRKV